MTRWQDIRRTGYSRRLEHKMLELRSASEMHVPMLENVRKLSRNLLRHPCVQYLQCNTLEAHGFGL